MGIQRNYSTRQISLILQFWRAPSRATESKAMRHLSRLAASGQTRVAESPSRLPRGALPWALVGDRWWLSDSTLRLSGATTPTASPGLSFTTCKANFRCADKGTSGWINHESRMGGRDERVPQCKPSGPVGATPTAPAAMVLMVHGCLRAGADVSGPGSWRAGRVSVSGACSF